eukprot:35365-Hanusia_phi.AAC.1
MAGRRLGQWHTPGQARSHGDPLAVPGQLAGPALSLRGSEPPAGAPGRPEAAPARARQAVPPGAPCLRLTQAARGDRTVPYPIGPRPQPGPLAAY